MAGYVIFDVGPFDREAMKPYLDEAFDTLKAYGGKRWLLTVPTSMSVKVAMRPVGGPYGYLSPNFRVSMRLGLGTGHLNIKQYCRSD
jgi:hypothetical protein